MAAETMRWILNTPVYKKRDGSTIKAVCVTTAAFWRVDDGALPLMRNPTCLAHAAALNPTAQHTVVEARTARHPPSRLCVYALPIYPVACTMFSLLSFFLFLLFSFLSPPGYDNGRDYDRRRGM